MITKVGLVGVGRWGRNLARVLKDLGALAWVCDLEPERLHAGDGRLSGVQLTTRFETMLEQPDLQAIVIATPAHLHAQMTHRALIAGKDVLVEKPLCLSVIEARDLSALARER